MTAKVKNPQGREIPPYRKQGVNGAKQQQKGRKTDPRQKAHRQDRRKEAKPL